MKIVSDFVDYYDAPARLMGDMPLYIRKTTEDYIWQRPLPRLTNFHQLKKEMFPSPLTDRDFFDKLTVIKVGSLIFSCLHTETKISVPKAMRTKRWETHETTVTYIFEGRNPHEKRAMDLALKSIPKIDSPIVVMQDKTTYSDCRLAGWQLYRVLDAYACAMELDRYLSNQTNPTVEPKPVDDIVKVVAHGFDVEHSFRKDKQQRKNR